MLAGQLNDGRRTCLIHMFEAVGAYYAGKLDEAGVEEYEQNACPTCGSCSGMYTANSMNCLTEAHRHGPAGQRHHSRRLLRRACGWPSTPACRSWSWSQKNIQSPGHHDRGRLPQRRDHGHGPGLLHQLPCSICPPSPTSAASQLNLDMANEISPQRLPTCATWPPPVTPIMEDLERGRRRLRCHERARPRPACCDTDADDLHRQDRRREHLRDVVNRNPEVIRPIENPYSTDRRHRRAERQSGPRRLRGQAVRPWPRR